MDTNREPSESRHTAKASPDQRELLRVTLSRIGDAVITTDKELSVTFLNPVAETFRWKRCSKLSTKKLGGRWRMPRPVPCAKGSSSIPETTHYSSPKTARS